MITQLGRMRESTIAKEQAGLARYLRVGKHWSFSQIGRYFQSEYGGLGDGYHELVGHSICSASAEYFNESVDNHPWDMKHTSHPFMRRHKNAFR